MSTLNPQIEFMTLYKPEHEAFIRFCKAKAYGVMDYKDLVNETLLRAFESFKKVEKLNSFKSYLIGIAIHVVQDQLRKQQSKEKFWDSQNRETPQTLNSAEQKFEIETLYKALEQLPNEQSEALILFEITGYSIREISAIQSVSEDAVKQRLKRGREKLGQILGVSEIKSEPIKRPSKVLFTLFF